MKHERRIPAWLLLVMFALAGMFACIWLFVIPLIAEGFRLIRSGKPDQRRFDTLADPPLAAEATLAQVLRRKACRWLDDTRKLVKRELADLAANNIGFMARIRCHLDLVQASRAHQRTTPAPETSLVERMPLPAARRAPSPPSPAARRAAKPPYALQATLSVFIRAQRGRGGMRAWRMTEGADASSHSPQRPAPRPRSEHNTRNCQLT